MPEHAREVHRIAPQQWARETAHGARQPTAAAKGRRTQRQRRGQQQAEGRHQATAEGRAQAPTARRSRPRTHGDMLTVAIRGHFAERMRELAESHGMSPWILLRDACSCMKEGGRLRQTDATIVGGAAH